MYIYISSKAAAIFSRKENQHERNKSLEKNQNGPKHNLIARDKKMKLFYTKKKTNRKKKNKKT